MSICQKCHGMKENYTYTRNQPKNTLAFPLSAENYTYLQNQPKNQPSIVLSAEHYDSDYSYAMYKPERHEKAPSPQEEKTWQGVL